MEATTFLRIILLRYFAMAKGCLYIFLFFISIFLILSLCGVKDPELAGNISLWIIIGFFVVALISAIVDDYKKRKKESESSDNSDSSDSSTKSVSIDPSDYMKLVSLLNETEDHISSDSQYISYCEKTADRIIRYILSVMKDEKLFQTIKDIRGIDALDTNLYGRYNSRVVSIVLHDIWKCYVGMGFQLYSKDSTDLCFVFAVNRLMGHDGKDSLQYDDPSIYSKAKDISDDTMKLMASLEVKGFEGEKDFLMQSLYKHIEENSSAYIKFLLNVSRCMASALPSKSEKTVSYLEELKAMITEEEAESISSNILTEYPYNASSG